jgi:hypothetical protein
MGFRLRLEVGFGGGFGEAYGLGMDFPERDAMFASQPGNVVEFRFEPFFA